MTSDAPADVPRMKIMPAGLLRILAMISYDTLLLAAVLFFAAVPTLLLPDASWHSAPHIQALKLAWFVFVSYLYFVISWLRGGQTPGMKSWRTFLVSCDGGNVTLKQATLRFFAAMLSWALVGAGYLWLLLDPDRRSLHDRLSGTCLQVRKRAKR